MGDPFEFRNNVASRTGSSLSARQQRAHAGAGAWARALRHSADWAVLDTETTGLDSNAEIIEVAVLDGHGRPLIDTLVRPVMPIPAPATSIHGITNRMVASAPTFAQIWPDLRELLATRRIIIYNADYDVRLLKQSAQRAGFRLPPLRTECAMLQYAAWRGEVGTYGDWKWQRLEQACAQLNVTLAEAAWHRAAGDCMATLAVISGMAGDSLDVPDAR